MGDVLDYLWEDFFLLVRVNVFYIFIVFIDGCVWDKVDELVECFCDMGVYIIVVGVGDVDYKELEEIVSDFDDENVFMISFDLIVNFVGFIFEDVCKGEKYFYC